MFWYKLYWYNIILILLHEEYLRIRITFIKPVSIINYIIKQSFARLLTFSSRWEFGKAAGIFLDKIYFLDHPTKELWFITYEQIADLDLIFPKFVRRNLTYKLYSIFSWELLNIKAILQFWIIKLMNNIDNNILYD